MELKDSRLLVTPTSYGITNPSLKSDLEAIVKQVIYNPTGKPLSSDILATMLKGVDGFIAGLDTIDRASLENADSLKIIARYGVGIDNVDLEAAREKGIIVTNTPGANSVSVAELALGLMLSLARQIPFASQQVRQGNWPRISGISLEGKTVGILGFGAIGKQLAQRLMGFNCQIQTFDPYPDIQFAKKHGVILMDSIDKVISNADFVSLHMPLLPETKGMVNAGFLAKMKAGSFLINTSRGEAVNEIDLYEAIKSGHLRGAGLDAFVNEPPSVDNPLLTLPQVIVTPHHGAHTDGATNNMGKLAMDDCLAVLRGEEPKHRVA
ncbi:MAG: phosphoglycerate dehydrogenase [Anaerolineaceae bacterium]|nr:phosphoglycerate dehydrogenase [Anaerolineaceae bacterium]